MFNSRINFGLVRDVSTLSLHFINDCLLGMVLFDLLFDLFRLQCRLLCFTDVLILGFLNAVELGGLYATHINPNASAP